MNNEEVSADTRLGGETIADNVWMDARQINLTYKNDIFSFEFSTMDFVTGRTSDLNIVWLNWVEYGEVHLPEKIESLIITSPRDTIHLKSVYARMSANLRSVLSLFTSLLPGMIRYGLG